MIKKLLLSTVLATYALSSNIYNTFPTDKEAFAFKKGFQLAIMSLIDAREFKIQGRKEDVAELKSFLVLVDSTDLDDADKMALQKIGFIYDDSIRLTNNTIMMADFKSKPNAVTLAKTLNITYFNKNAPHRRAYVYETKQNEVFYKEKSLAYEIAELIEEELKSEMKAILITDKSPKSNTQTQNTQKEQIVPQAVLTPKKVEKPTAPAKKTAQPVKTETKEPVKPTKVSKVNTQPFFIQFAPKGKYVIRYKLIKDLNDKTIDSSDFIKQSQIENNGELLMADNYIITTDDKKFIKSENGFFYLEKSIEVINDFTKDN